MKALTICSQLGCPEPAVARGRCPAHQPTAWSGSTRRDATKSPAWRRRRAAVLRRDGHRCTFCGSPATQVDHVVPVHLGGTDDPTNLTSLCAACHARKSAAEGGRASQRARRGEG